MPRSSREALRRALHPHARTPCSTRSSTSPGRCSSSIPRCPRSSSAPFATDRHPFGERAGQSSPAPDGDTILRLGSITKAFTGEMLAHLTADGPVQLAQPLAKWAPDLTRRRERRRASDPDLVTEADIRCQIALRRAMQRPAGGRLAS
jgi:CubicO group peptidase (beta-lactamase class C family)